MTQKTYRLRGIAADTGGLPHAPVTTQVSLTAPRRLMPGRTRDGDGDSLEVASDDAVRVEFEDGSVLWTRADRLVADHGQRVTTRGADDAWEFDQVIVSRAPLSARGERGISGVGIKVLDFFGVDLKGLAAAEIGKRIEQSQLKEAPGLYRCPFDAPLTLRPLSPTDLIAADQGPILVLIHGTMSSAAGTFGKLWLATNQEGAAARNRLQARYGDRVFAFEHYTLTESPITNALALVDELGRRLGGRAEVHLLTHSRGGLVGELLCLSGIAALDAALPADQLQTLFDSDRTIAPQLGLSPLDTAAAAAHSASYAADRAALGKLIALLKDPAQGGKIVITRFVRAACPARGTTLASGRLDRWLSVLKLLGVGNELIEGALDFLLAVIKERTDPRTLPGVEAMMPGAALTRFLNLPALKTSADLTVIAGDIEGDSTWQKLKLLMTDWFYGTEHDLVVNTSSMTGGLQRPERGARYLTAVGADVNHFNYFANAPTVRWLVAGLLRADTDDGGFQSIALAPRDPPRWRGAVARSRDATTPRPLAVVLPGTMGSHLLVDNKHVWLDYAALFMGGLKKLKRDANNVLAGDLLDDFYGPLLEFLARSHRVEIFGYDWRLSVRAAAAKLVERLEMLLPRAEQERQPVHLVAHSMGGLVVRAMIADGGRGSALWRRLTGLPNSRFLMLGTPNLGSYEAVRWLTGFNPSEAKLALLDFTQSMDGVIDLVREYPGLLELLPFALSDPDFADVTRWEKIRSATDVRWHTASAADLGASKSTWALLRDAAPDPQFMRYVAGCQPATVIDYELADFGDPKLPGLQRLNWIATAEGDGTVAWASGRLPGIPTWYVADTGHDALCAQPAAFPGYLELLMTGATALLPSAPPSTARDIGEVLSRFALPPTPPCDGIPTEQELLRAGFGAGLPPTTHGLRTTTPSVQVSIRHGDLSYARHPVLVGHYVGDTIISAEKVLDRQLGGALVRRLELGLYPDHLGMHGVFFNEHAAGKPGGAIVIGLGQVGELAPSLLESGARAALLDYALQVARWPDTRFGAPGKRRSAAVTCLLVGSGAGGITIHDSLESILRAVVAANQKLIDKELDGKVWIDRIEFIELFEDVAISACAALRRVLQNQALAASVTWPEQVVVDGHAGRRRVRFDEAPGWWQRLEITEDPDRAGLLRFIYASDRARAEETLATGQLALADAFIREASQSATANEEASRTLFEMLLPIRLKEMAPRQSDLVILVDTHSARYPWELLENRWSENGRPPAVNAGLVRQLKTREFRGTPLFATEAKALVIGNPALNWALFSDLPGARSEAQQVVKLLGDRHYEVTGCVDATFEVIVKSLHRDAYRIIHFAGHGVHDFPSRELVNGSVTQSPTAARDDERTVSGMVIGNGAILTPGDVQQMRWVPELVFINCCHLGQTLTKRSSDHAGLAANLGVEFISMGARAVVAAGWAVDDAAGQKFAETFYARMLEGEAFGDAVRAAREEIWRAFPGVNTWGAYQCYGDHDFRLHKDGSTRPTVLQLYHAPAEFVVDLENYARALEANETSSKSVIQAGADLATFIARIPPPQGVPWLARADVQAALGFAYGEAKLWDKAITCLQAALLANAGDCPLRVIEQHANYSVCLAADEWEIFERQPQSDRRDRATAYASCVTQIETAIAELTRLSTRAATAERHELLGSAYKRLATVLESKPARQRALVKMAAHYRTAFEFNPDRDQVYPFTNWATAQLLVTWTHPGSQPALLESLTTDAARVTRTLDARELEEPDFWNSAGHGDVTLVQLLAHALTAKPATPRAKGKRRTTSVGALSSDALEAEIIADYERAIERGASPRQRAAIIDNIDFLLDMLGSRAADLRASLERISARL